MVHHLHARLRSDDGIGLIEIMIAIVILGVVLSALAATIITSLAAMHKDELRVRATHVANQELELLRAQEWESVGFYSNDNGYAATWDGNDTVTLGATRPAGSSAPVPQGAPITVDGIDYTVTRSIVWVDDDADGLDPTDTDPQDYKQFHVEVTWDERGQTRSIESTSTRTPTTQEVPLVAASAAPGTLTVTAADIQPNPVTITPSGTTGDDIVVNVTTSEPANTVKVAVPLGATFMTYSMSSTSGSTPDTDWTFTFPAGTNSFSPGSYDFTITAMGTTGTDVHGPISITFAEDPSIVLVEVQDFTISPQLCAANSGQLHVATTVPFEVTGLGSGDTGSVSWTSQNGGTNATLTGSSGSSATFTAQIPAGTKFTGSTTTITATGVRTSDNEVATLSKTFPVTKTNDPGACP